MELKEMIDIHQLRYSTNYTFRTLQETDTYIFLEVRREDEIYMYSIYFQIEKNFYLTELFLYQMKEGEPTFHTIKLIVRVNEKTSEINIGYERINVKEISNEQQRTIIGTMDGFIDFINHLPAYRLKSIVEGWEWQWSDRNGVVNWEELKENKIS